jgi:dipeptidyl aminopeptidase/acylaminoacyl peptidase
MFCGEIIAEYWMPKKASGKAIVICDGAPGVPSKNKLGQFFARKGYWVFHPRYRGTWESKGEFLKQSPVRDVDDVINALSSGFRDAATGVQYYLDIREVTVVGASFGGAAAIMSTINPLVVKAVAVAPVVDWAVATKEEPFEKFVSEITDGFPGAYRAPLSSYKKLLKKKFYNPVDHVAKLNGKKLFLIHAKDDTCVPYQPTKKLAKKIGATYVERIRGGHLGSGIVMEKDFWSRIAKFLDRP